MESDTEPKFDKKLPFNVPDGYFDRLPQKIFEKCANTIPAAKQTKWKLAIKSQLSFAAGFAALAIIASLAYYLSQKITTQSAIDRNIDYVEIVSRKTYYNPNFKCFRHTKTRTQRTDSLNEFTNGRHLRYYAPKNKFSNISEEKLDPNSYK